MSAQIGYYVNYNEPMSDPELCNRALKIQSDLWITPSIPGWNRNLKRLPKANEIFSSHDVWLDALVAFMETPSWLHYLNRRDTVIPTRF